ncbi:outer membrane protein assembly factor BamC [Paucibacter sp. APW11]|uniref:Outer membrane protein assembly factor BamC n=1 Tax=Roseateles aquae TaxID=3077235 RepID=A0ABU3P8Q6_9BURK|nr:outer membrane protein assembly factor BamC [Paucibacter sp. APW11]MDT8998957.1 outer membrane protein assembly factor BamC [Paucibacter sp. APW11]
MSSVTRPFIVSSKALACASLAATLAGCGTVEGMFSSDKVDYRTGARQTTGLDVPPDLTQLVKEQRAQNPDGVVSAVALQQRSAGSGAATKPTAAMASQVALNSAGDVRLERSGDVRFLRTSATPEQLWPLLLAFWQERGLEVVKQQPELGLIETNWAENRARLPQDVIRQTIGKVFDGLYSTGERDMYRTRVERSAGGTEIYISHRGMKEVYTGTQKDSTAWQPRPAEVDLEIEMLSRLMLKLGGKDLAPTTTADAGAKTTVLPTAPSEALSRPLAEVPNQLTVKDGFDLAWRRVGQSLDRHGFTIEDRDRKQGLFFLRYADPTKVGKEEPGFFAKLFGTDKAVTAGRYRVSVKAEGEQTIVKVLDDKGQLQTDENAKRIMSLLMDDLR